MIAVIGGPTDREEKKPAIDIKVMKPRRMNGIGGSYSSSKDEEADAEPMSDGDRKTATAEQILALLGKDTGKADQLSELLSAFYDACAGSEPKEETNASTEEVD